jgi:hypothetical protein
MERSDLDKHICDVEEHSTNTQTYREFIRESEEEFGLAPAPLDNLSAKELTKYLDFVDDLWLK